MPSRSHEELILYQKSYLEFFEKETRWRLPKFRCRKANLKGWLHHRGQWWCDVFR